MTPRCISSSVAPGFSTPKRVAGGVPSGWPVHSSQGRAGSRRARARAYMASAPVTSTTSCSPRLIPRQASCIRAWGLFPPMDETMSSAGSSPSAKPRRAATSRAGLGTCQPSGATTLMLSALPMSAAARRGRPARRGAVAVLRRGAERRRHERQRLGPGRGVEPGVGRRGHLAHADHHGRSGVERHGPGSVPVHAPGALRCAVRLHPPCVAPSARITPGSVSR